MNRKGDLPTILLFLATLVLVVFALFSFVTFKGGFGDRSRDFARMASEVEFRQGYLEKKAGIMVRESVVLGESDLKRKFMGIAAGEDKGIEDIGRFFEKVGRGEFSFERVGAEYVFGMEGLVVFSEVGASSMNRSFEIGIRFDSDGKVLEIS